MLSTYARVASILTTTATTAVLDQWSATVWRKREREMYALEHPSRAGRACHNLRYNMRGGGTGLSDAPATSTGATAGSRWERCCWSHNRLRILEASTRTSPLEGIVFTRCTTQGKQDGSMPRVCLKALARRRRPSTRARGWGRKNQQPRFGNCWKGPEESKAVGAGCGAGVRGSPYIATRHAHESNGWKSGASEGLALAAQRGGWEVARASVVGRTHTFPSSACISARNCCTSSSPALWSKSSMAVL
jgi:hypothetical protein